MFKRIYKAFTNWLVYEPPSTDVIPVDFNRLVNEIQPGDVLLIEGRSRVSTIIRTITQSPWTHAALYVGRLIDSEDEVLAQKIITYGENIKPKTRLIIEDLLDKGTVITHLSDYRHHHIRICRAIGITQTDMQAVVNHTLNGLGQPYNVRHFLDLARFMLPWTILPRRWGSSLFRTRTGQPESGICSSLIAEAFLSVQFPILPYFKPNEETGTEVYARNPYLFTPKDFDFSPYFEIIKYPLFSPEEPLPYYRRLPWSKKGILHHDHGILSDTKKIKDKDKDKDQT